MSTYEKLNWVFWARTFSNEATSSVDTSRMELHELKILARQASTNNHTITITGASVGRCARHVSSAVALLTEMNEKLVKLGSKIINGHKTKMSWLLTPVARTVLWARNLWILPSSRLRAITPLHSPFSIIKSRAKYSMKKVQLCLTAWPYRVWRRAWPVRSATAQHLLKQTKQVSNHETIIIAWISLLAMHLWAWPPFPKL